MKKTETYSYWKRSFSLLLTFVLIFGMVPMPSFALPAGVSITNPGNNTQTVLPASLSNGQIWTDKSVKYLGSTNPSDPLNGQFEIKLRAAGQNYNLQNPPAKFDVILALDYSYSMGSGSNSKLKRQETAAIQIAKNLIDAGNRVAIIKYNDEAELQNKHGTFMTNKSHAEDVINDNFDGTYTNIQNAFLLSLKTFNSRSLGETNKPVLILISDGEPTIYYDSLTEHDDDHWHRNASSGSNYVSWTVQQGMDTKKGKDKVVSADDVSIYTIGFDLENNNTAKATLQPTGSNKYWLGSYIISNDYSALYNALNAIAQNLTTTKPLSYVANVGYSNLVIEDVLGSGFEVLGSLPTGVTQSGSTVTWTINGDNFVTQAPDTATLDPTKVSEVVFKVKIKDAAAVNTTHYTNTSAKGMFNVAVSNPFYADNALSQQQPLNNNGWLTLSAPPVAASITVTKQVTGPVTATNRTFSFTLYDAASNGNIIAGPINITVNGASSNTGTFNFNIPYNGFNGNNQATFYVQENNTGIPVHWAYDLTARKAVTVSRSTPIGSASFTNSYAPTGTLVVKKAWTGNGPQSDVTFNLYKLVGENWVAVSTGHTILAGATNGVIIRDLALDTQYKVVENGIQDYLTSYDPTYVEFSTLALVAGEESLEKTITIKNDYQTPIGKIKLTKSWVDDDNAAGDRPSQVTFNIQGPAGYTGQSQIILTAAGGWTNTLSTYTFGDYTFTEVVPLDYKPSVNPQSQSISINPVSAREAALTFTNTYVVPKGKLTVKKSWADETANFAEFRPANITLKLLKDGILTGDTVILPEADATPWEHTFENLAFGVYSVEELSVPDYTVSYSPNVTLTKFDPTGGPSLRSGQINVTNTFKNPKGEITVSKKWVEGGIDVSAVRPVSIDVTLVKNGSPLSTQTLNDANEWTYKFTGLDLDGASYIVTETSIDAASLSMYEAQFIYSGTGAASDHLVIGPSARSGSVAITNTYAKGTITVAKIWVDKENPDTLPIDAVVTLHKVKIIPPVLPLPDPSNEAGAPPIVGVQPPTIEDTVIDTQTISRPNNTPVVFYDLEIAENVYYYVVEGDIPYYTPSFDKSNVTLSEEQPNATIKVTNTYDDPKGSLTVTKEWDHGNNPDRPTEITVELYADGVYLTKMTFSGSYTFENLALGKVYTIKEVKTDNYATDYNEFVSYTPVKDKSVDVVYPASVTIDNTYIPELGNLVVNKEWVGKTGAAIEITVTRSYGDTADDGFILTHELNSQNEWSHLFEGLEVYGPGGVKYTYSVQEDGPDLVLYSSDTSDTAVLNTDETSVITIVNTYAPEKGQLVITKVWLGLEEEHIEPPVSFVEVRLVVNGVPEESTMILNDENDWTVYRSELNVDNTYSVVEVTRFEEFDVQYSPQSITFNAESLSRKIYIYNTRTVDEPSIDVNKSLSNALVQLSGGTATFNYAVQLTNDGNRTLNALSVLDKMTGPTGATITYNPAPDSTDVNGAWFELDGNLEPGQSMVFNYSVTVNLAGTYTNVATGSGYYIETLVSDTGEATGVATNPPTPNPDPDPDPDPVLGLVNVTFVDTDGVTLSPGYQMAGAVGTNYLTTAREVAGYSLVETPANANGTFVSGSLSVIYVYDVTGEIVTEEETPLGEAATEAPTVEEVIVPEEDTPLADALPKTGQLPPELFYGLGGLVSAAGVFLKKRK